MADRCLSNHVINIINYAILYDIPRNENDR